jgi:hypothetical protein
LICRDSFKLGLLFEALEGLLFEKAVGDKDCSHSIGHGVNEGWPGEGGSVEMGRQKWEENQRRIEKFWDDVDLEVDGLGLAFDQIRIYQDGLPCAGSWVRGSCEKRLRKEARTTR